jgi:hypothetical protein
LLAETQCEARGFLLRLGFATGVLPDHPASGHTTSEVRQKETVEKTRLGAAEAAQMGAAESCSEKPGIHRVVVQDVEAANEAADGRTARHPVIW